MHCARTPRQSVTDAHWILEIPRKTNMPMEWKRRSLLGILISLGQMSCKSFLKSQVGIISLGAFKVFCEARANTGNP